MERHLVRQRYIGILDSVTVCGRAVSQTQISESVDQSEGEDMQIVLLGSATLRLTNLVRLNELLHENGLPDFKSGVNDSEQWQTANDGEDFGCAHLTHPAAVMGAATPLSVQKFLFAAMKLPGAYTTCPEHNKRRFWEQQEQKIEQRGSGKTYPITALAGKENQKVRLIRPGSSSVEGIFKGLEGSYAVIMDDHNILPHHVDSTTEVVFL